MKESLHFAALPRHIPAQCNSPRNLFMELEDRVGRFRFLLRDRDAKFSRSFNEVFRSEGGQVLVTPVRAPKANAYAERWVRTVRTEGLDRLLIVGRGHLQQGPPGLRSA